MFSISKNNIITIARGDSAEFNYQINLGTDICPEIYELTGDDVLYFGVCQPQEDFEDAIIRKTFTADDFNTETLSVNIVFNPNDTKYLMPGTYYYSIKLKKYLNPSHIVITTLQTKKKFIIVD